MSMTRNELDKLEQYLIDNGFKYRRTDNEWRHIICVLDDEGNVLWDAICHKGSYGYESGLLEIMGDIVYESEREYDDVVGWLTAEDVIERIKN